MQSSFLSSGDGDTEILYTSDFCSTHLDDDDEEEEEERGKNLAPDYTKSMSRSRSLMELDKHQITSRDKRSRAKSLPSLKYPADKHVRFRTGQVLDDAETCGIEDGWSESQVEGTAKKKGVGSVKSKEIYIAYSLFSGFPFNDESRDQGKGESNGPAVEEGGQPQQTQKLDERVNGETVTAWVSTGSTDSSPRPGGGAGCDNSHAHKELAGTSHSTAESSEEHCSSHSSSLNCLKSDLNESLEIKIPSSPATRDHATVKSVITTNAPFHEQPKKHVTIPVLGTVDLHGSGVFSSGRYGPIVSAAESTTLSCGSSEQDLTDPSSLTSSTALRPLSQDLTQRYIHLWN